MQVTTLKDTIRQCFEDATNAEDDGKYDLALSICDDVIRLDRMQSNAWKMRTRLLMALNKLDAAFETAKEAEGLFPNSASHRLMQARIHVRCRRWPEAAATYRAVLRDEALSLNAIRELMDFETITPDDPICQTLRDHQHDQSLKPYDRASTWFLQGQIYLNAGRDDEAFALYEEGNRQMRALHAGQRMEYGFSRILADFDAAFQRRNAPSDPPPPCPAFLIVGLPRSGKSVLERLLASQPDLVAGGEVSFLYSLFLDVDRSQGAEAALRRLKIPQPSPIMRRFSRLLAQSGKAGATRVIDTTPGNLEQLAFLGPLHPDVPIVFVRRDPRDFAAALFFKQFNKAHRYSYDLGTAARAIARTEYLARRWQETMPNPMIELSYEETVRDPVATGRRVIERFGLRLDVPALERAAQDDGRKLNLMPGRSLDGVGAIRADLIGFSERFAKHLEGVLPAYEGERRRLLEG